MLETTILETTIEAFEITPSFENQFPEVFGFIDGFPCGSSFDRLDQAEPGGTSVALPNVSRKILSISKFCSII
jgi:hypothetical protein